MDGSRSARRVLGRVVTWANGALPKNVDGHTMKDAV